MIRLFLPFCLCAALAAAPAGGPALRGKITGGFQAPSAVDQQGRRSVIKGMNATSRSDSVYEITEPQVTSFNAANEPEMFINAERCLFDQRSNVAQSDSRLSMRTADQRFSLEGQGWLWDSRSSYLSISNQVVATVEKSVIEPSSTNSPAARTNQPVRITSDRFRQEGDNASFIGNVVVQDGPDTLRCSRLNLLVAKPGGVRSIEAVGNVELVQGETQVRSGHGLYDLQSNTLTITQAPSWTSGQREGSAEKLLLDRAANTLAAEGKVLMKLPLTNSIAGARTNQLVEIGSEHFLFKNSSSNAPSEAIYREDVRVVHPQGTIRSAELIARFDAQERIDELRARGDVVIESEGRRAFGEQARYDLIQEKISLTGQPRWEMDQRTGRSELVVFHPRSKELFALGGVEMFFPARSRDLTLPGSDRNGPPSETNSPMRVVAETFSHQSDVAVFHQKVRIEDDRGTIDCQLMTIVTGASNQVQRIVAQENVRIAQKDMVATGDRAEYNMQTGLIHLTGNPRLTGPDKSLESEAFVIDRNRNTFSVTPGNYRIELKLKKKVSRE
jgi:lipopolysaccharide transport protein LptA